MAHFFLKKTILVFYNFAHSSWIYFCIFYSFINCLSYRIVIFIPIAYSRGFIKHLASIFVSDCMKFYGCDKPDLRIESRIKDVTSLITKDKSSKMVQKILHDGVADDVRVKCVKFGAKSLIETPSSTYMTKEIPEILNK